MFKKVGDSLPIGGMLESDGQEQVCPKCHQSMNVVAFDEEDTAKSTCQCEIDEDIYEKN